MKTQKTTSQVLYLKKTNKRWKWMAGATAAGVTASQASLVTINLTNNYISCGGNHLNADITGDGHPDLTIANPFTFLQNPKGTYMGRSYPSYNRSFVRVFLNGVYAQFYVSNDYGFGSARLGPQFSYFGAFSATGGVHPYASLTGSIPIFFKDLRINDGAPTSGSLEVTVSAGSLNKIQLDNLTYTSNTPVGGSIRAVPDQGSSLALLAMGGCGILALRRWRAAQEHS